MNSLSLMYNITTNLNEYQGIVFEELLPGLTWYQSQCHFLAYICHCNTLFPFFRNLFCITYNVPYSSPCDNLGNAWYTHRIPSPRPRDILRSPTSAGVEDGATT